MKKITKKIASILVAATMAVSAFSTAVSAANVARKGFSFGSPNFKETSVVYFTYYGEQPKGWKANVGGKLKVVGKGEEFVIYKFVFKEATDKIALSSYDANGQLLDKATMELI